jgi:hypothetical protein
VIGLAIWTLITSALIYQRSGGRAAAEPAPVPSAA